MISSVNSCHFCSPSLRSVVDLQQLLELVCYALFTSCCETNPYLTEDSLNKYFQDFMRCWKQRFASMTVSVQ